MFLVFVLGLWFGYEVKSRLRFYSHLHSQKPKASDSPVIMISYFGNLWEGDLDDVAIRTFHFDTWGGKCLCSFQTVNDSAHSSSVCGENLDVWLAVKRLKCRQGFRHFQGFYPSCQFQLTTLEVIASIVPTTAGFIVSVQIFRAREPPLGIWRIENVVYSSDNPKLVVLLCLKILKIKHQ